MVVGLLSWSLATRLGNTTAIVPTAAGIPAPVRPAGEAATSGAVGDVATTSEAVLAIQGMPGEAAQAPTPATEAPGAPDTAPEAEGLAALPPPVAAPPAAPQAAPPSSARPSPRVAQPAASRRELEPIPYPNVPPPGAIREALGALLAARAEPSEFSSAPSAADPAPARAESRPAPPPAASGDAPPVVRKETERESSGSESLLVEKPSF